MASNLNNQNTPLLTPEMENPQIKSSSSISIPIENNEALTQFHELEDTPHGRHLGVFGVVMMIIQRIIGSGIFAVSSMIYRDVGGCTGLFFLVWIIAGYSSYAGISCFGELGSIVPRSGGMKVFLEYIYFKPKMMMSVVFNCYTLLFGSIIANVIVLGEYLLYACGYDADPNMAKIIGLIFLFFSCLTLGISTKIGVKIQNITGVLKLLLLCFISLTGLYVLIFPFSLTKIENNFHLNEFFKVKSTVTFSSFSSALLKAIFSFNGWQTTHVVMNEIKDPVQTMKIAAPLALLLINACYLLINLSYLIVIPGDELLNIDEMVGSILFEKIFGEDVGRRFLTAIVAFSVAGNIIVVLYHISRMNQEIFRSGFLPYSRFFASNAPFGAPLRSLLIPFFITAIVISIPTDANIFNYAINLESYPLQFFIGLICFGIVLIRRRDPNLNPAIKASKFDIFFMCSFCLIMFIGPLTKSNTEFAGLPNYAWLSIFILLLCVAYWYGMFIGLPKLRGYTLEVEDKVLSDGLVIKTWKKVSSDGQGYQLV
ncbi:Mup3 protein [Martiniozyma asiatica (nom. inval.)]|nr:Mup3 protein [Martiniozyma asiatica]